MSNRQRKAAKRALCRHSTPPSARASNRVFPPLPDWLSQNSPQNYATLDLLATDPSSALPAADELDEAALSVLARLRSALDLHQWKDVPGRLRLLEQRFGRPVPRATLPDTPPPGWAELHERIWQSTQAESWRFK